MRPTLDFWFDFSCPYAYLASTQVESLAEKAGSSLAFRPMLLGGVFRAVKTPQVLAQVWSEAKNRHNLADMHRWAALWGVDLSMPPAHPMRTVDALRLTLAAGIPPSLVHRIYRAYWSEGLDIADRAVLSTLADEAGHDGSSLLGRIDDLDVKEALRRLTEQAVGLGIFGAPSFVVNGELLFWGQDRMEFVERALLGWRPSIDARPDLNTVLERALPRREG